MLGTAGGMYHFRDQIRLGNPTAFFVLNGDVCSDFPLNALYEFHKSKTPKAMVRSLIYITKTKKITHFFHFSDHNHEYRSHKTTITELW